MSVEVKNEETGLIEVKSKLQQLTDTISEAKDSFDEGDYIVDLYHYYLMAVQNLEPKYHLFIDEDDWRAHGSPCWNEESLFDEFLSASRSELVDHRIPEIKEKLRLKSCDIISPFQKSIEGFADKINFEDPLEMNRMDILYHEYMDWALHMQKEAIDNFNAGKVKVLEKDVLNNEVDIEVGKIADKIVSKTVPNLNTGEGRIITNTNKSQIIQ